MLPAVLCLLAAVPAARAQDPPMCCKTRGSGLTFTRDMAEARLPRRILFHVPPGFNREKPFSLLVYLQDPGAPVGPYLRNLRVMEQVDESGANAILVAPQLPPAGEPSPAAFSLPGAFRAFLEEAANALRDEMGLAVDPRFDTAPVILAAHRGGDATISRALEQEGTYQRIAGLLLLAPLLERPDALRAWLLGRHREVFLAALVAPAEEGRARELAAALRQGGASVREDGFAGRSPGSLSFLPTAADPARVPLTGPPENPVSFFLR